MHAAPRFKNTVKMLAVVVGFEERMALGKQDPLGRREGGLMMIYGLYPGVPLENVEALMDALEKYSTFYS